MSRSYYMLVASLPPMPASFETPRLPISGPRLEHRLRLLEDDDLESIERMRNLLFWERLKLDLDEREIVRRYELFLSVERNAIVREVAATRLETRTIVAALRRKRLGKGPPTAVGPWVDPIRRNWSEPQFQLGYRFPWVAPLERALETGDVGEADRIIIAAPWERFTRLAQQHHFSFEAVVLYVARWDVLHRWTSRDEAKGRARIEQLASEALGTYGELD